MFKGLTNMMLTAVVLQIKMVLIYYCLYSAVVYNFLMELMLDPSLPVFFTKHDKLILLLISIISAYTLNRTIKSAPAKVVQETVKPLNILKPGEQIR